MNLNFTESRLKYLNQFEGETRIEMERTLRTLRTGIVASQYRAGITIQVVLKEKCEFEVLLCLGNISI